MSFNSEVVGMSNISFVQYMCSEDLNRAPLFYLVILHGALNVRKSKRSTTVGRQKQLLISMNKVMCVFYCSPM